MYVLQAKWYCYSKMHVSKTEFEDEYFRAMLKEQADGSETFFLNAKNLKDWVRAEFGIFLVYLKYINALKFAESKGMFRFRFCFR